MEVLLKTCDHLIEMRTNKQAATVPHLMAVYAHKNRKKKQINRTTTTGIFLYKNSFT